MEKETDLYGLMAEFDNADRLLEATRRTYDAGYHKIDAYSPYPVEGLAEAMNFRRTYIPLIMLIGGITGAVAGYGMQYYIHVIDFPVNIGGRPLNSWPMFIPVVFELTILFSALAGVIGMLALNGLPMPYHPVFNVPAFAAASRDRFFLVIMGTDPQFDYAETRRFLASLSPREVSDVPN